MGGVLLDRGDECEECRLGTIGLFPQDDDISDLELAVGQRACLVEDDGVDTGEVLDRLAAFHQDAVRGGLIHPGLEGDRRAQLERAGVIDEKHGLQAGEVAGHPVDRCARSQGQIDPLIGESVGLALRVGALVE